LPILVTLLFVVLLAAVASVSYYLVERSGQKLFAPSGAMAMAQYAFAGSIRWHGPIEGSEEAELEILSTTIFATLLFLCAAPTTIPTILKCGFLVGIS
jgi:hypothetical protein